MRGLSVLFVILYHYTYRYYEIYPSENHFIFEFYNGKYGVQSFFIISGFVIFMSLKRIDNVKEFIKHRFIRLYPTFWFSVLLTFTIVSLFGLPDREVSFYQMLLNLSMISGQFGIPNVDGVYWTLLYELKFYFLIAIIFSLNYIKYIDNILLMYLLFSLSLVMFGLDETLFYKVLNQIFIFDFMSYFISGIVFYKISIGEDYPKLYIILFL